MSVQIKKKEPHYSPVKFILEAQNNAVFKRNAPFVAFAQERDHLGRLIRN